MQLIGTDKLNELGGLIVKFDAISDCIFKSEHKGRQHYQGGKQLVPSRSRDCIDGKSAAIPKVKFCLRHTMISEFQTEIQGDIGDCPISLTQYEKLQYRWPVTQL